MKERVFCEQRVPRLSDEGQELAEKCRSEAYAECSQCKKKPARCPEHLFVGLQTGKLFCGEHIPSDEAVRRNEPESGEKRECA
jgi:hypothetical protein